jgi:hypothetical protein
MKIDQKFIGAKVKSNLLNRYFVIEEGNEELYIKLGLLHIFVNSEPKIKIINVKTREISDINTDSDSNGISDSDSPLLAP